MRAYVFALASLLVTASASASPTFPAEIATHLGAPTPACSICHQGTPAMGTATAPFAVAMKARGLVPNDLASLDTALDALAAEGTDSNGNGIPDIQEIKDGKDPNATSSGGTVTPQYGWSCAAGGRAGAGAAGVLALLTLGLVGRGARSASRRRVAPRGSGAPAGSARRGEGAAPPRADR